MLTQVLWYRPFITNILLCFHKTSPHHIKKKTFAKTSDSNRRLQCLTFYVYLDIQLNHVVKRSGIWTTSISTYLVPVSHLIQLTPCQASVERDVFQTQFSYFFVLPNIFPHQTFGASLRLFWFISHILLSKYFSSSNLL